MKINLLKRLGPILGILGSVLILFNCEDFQDQTYVMSDAEQVIYDRLHDSLYVDIVGGDLRVFGPQWTGMNVSAAFASEKRIGNSWYDADYVLEPDVFVFVTGADTVGAMRFLSFVNDAGDGSVDSLRFAYVYNPDGDPNFSGDLKDTVMAVGVMSTPFYFSLKDGSVASSASWDFSIDADMISLGANTKVHRKENTNLTLLTSAPSTNYFADGNGFALSLSKLNTDSTFLIKPDSLLKIKMDAAVDASYLVWDRSGEAAGEQVLVADNYMSINIWDENGTQLSPVSTDISMELIAYCDKAKTLYRYALGTGPYLVQFLAHEAMLSNSFFLSVTEGE